MKKLHLTIIICTLSIMLLLAMDVKAEQRSLQLNSYLQQAIQKAFNLEFSSANNYLQKAIELDPQNPAGYAYLSAVSLFAYEMNFDENARRNLQNTALRYADEAIARGEKRIAGNPRDGNAYMVTALAKFAKFNWASRQKDYLEMARESSSIWTYLEKSRENEPQNFDLYCLTGTLRYHISNLPAATRLLSSVVVTSGDKQKGLQELELATRKGNLLRYLAMSELSSDYLNFEKQPVMALPMLEELKRLFPNNYNFSFALANAFSDMGRFDDALEIARELEKNIRAATPPYVPQLQPRHDQLMGRIFFTHGEYNKAEEYLQKSLKDASPYNARVRVWAFLRLGMINDTRKDRKKAEEYYTKALNIKERAGTAQTEAKKYLGTPYVAKHRI